MSDTLIILTGMQRLKLMQAGQYAYRDGLPLSAAVCPYDLNSDDPREVAYGAAWVRGYVVTRNIDTEKAGRPFYEQPATDSA